MPSRGLDQQQVYALIAQVAGQANILTIPRLFIDWTGDHITALLLSQVIYWSSRTDDSDGWFYKSAKDWEEELSISDYQLARATKKLAEVGLETKLRKIHGAPTQHYRIDQNEFLKWISEKLGNGFPTNSEMDFEESRKSISDIPVNPLTEITTEITSHRPFEVSKAPTNQLNITIDDRSMIGRYMEDLARELRDEAPLASSATRACRIYVESGLPMDDFITAMLEARRRTQENSGNIQKPSSKGRVGEKSKMGYFFAVLEDVSGLKISNAG